MKRHWHLKSILMLAGLLLLATGLNNCTIYTQAPSTVPRHPVTLPAWAPPYADVNDVRYYYFPDIECFYDVWNQEFIYPEDGSWMFGATLPPFYDWYDLNSAFVVLLDNSVFDPWMHFQYYVSHYPRYYYRSIYRGRYDDEAAPFRGFNENDRSIVYRHERTGVAGNKPEGVQTVRPRTEGDHPVIQQKAVENDNERRMMESQQLERQRMERVVPQRTVPPTRPSVRMEYYGREIGEPVRVRSNMMEHPEGRRR